MTTRTVLFDSPFLLGFDHTRSLIDRAARAASEAYPPYNVEQRGEAAVRITLAVAGFSPDDLSITLEGRQLTISGKRDGADKGDGGNAYLHRGIAARGFLRTFVLADGLEVEEASLEHGLLHVDLLRPEQVAQTRRIPITTR
ncbi:MAG: Hsp20 family protein [Brevundimonas sp.]|uniref:Hsp20 family protein n=1 Tax=Brevundimonas sp. TaxID=1871086 RepID=UPI0030036C87